MQAIILAAGKSSRFYPYRSFSHKSLISVMGKPIILYTIEAVRKSEIEEILLVVSPKSAIEKLLGDGKKYGIKITYIVQKEPTGAGNGLLLAEKFVKGNFFLLNVSRVDFDFFKNLLLAQKENNTKAVLLGRKQAGLKKYGVLKVKGDRVVNLIEKPSSKNKPSDIRIIGIYLFSKDFFKALREAPDEHYRLEKAISNLSKKEEVRFVLTDRNVPSLKYSWDLFEVKNYLLSTLRGQNISRSAKISKSAEIIGNVTIENGAEIMEGAKIKGPCFIGKNSTVGNNAVLRNGVDIEENCVVGANIEIKNSLIMKNTKVHSGFIGDSIIGEDVRIGAQFTTANKRIDRKTVSVQSPDGKKIDTGLKSLGTIIGSNVSVGIRSSTMPGVIIGENSTIGPSTTVFKNVPPRSKYYTKFAETVVKK